jgi:hypothetical protein
MVKSTDIESLPMPDEIIIRRLGSDQDRRRNG